MLRSEAAVAADKLHETHPKNFLPNSLELGEDGIWVATWIDPETDPPQVIVERWADVYTEKDPEPEPDESEAEETEETSPLARTLRDYLAARPGQWFTSFQIATALGVPAEEVANAWGELNGQVQHRNGRQFVEWSIIPSVGAGIDTASG